jgi:BMFP domain-containing protein YqiC
MAVSCITERIMTTQRPFPDAIETLTAKLSEALAAVLPAGADWQRTLSPIIESTLERLELVPREDFERQRAQLERLSRDVAQLEERIAALEPRRPH